MVSLDTGTRGPTKALGCGGCGPDSIRESQELDDEIAGRNVI